MFQINTDGSGLTNLSNHSGQDNILWATPGVPKLMFASDRDDPSNARDLFMVDFDGQNLVNLTNSLNVNENGLRWRPCP